MTAETAYPKRVRLRQRHEFTRVLSQGQVFPGQQALVRRTPNRLGEARLGVSTPKGYGRAVRRNTFRRLAREAFRHIRSQLGAWDYLVSPRRQLRCPTLTGLQRDLLRTLAASPAPPRQRRTGKGPRRTR